MAGPCPPPGSYAHDIHRYVDGCQSALIVQPLTNMDVLINVVLPPSSTPISNIAVPNLHPRPINSHNAVPFKRLLAHAANHRAHGDYDIKPRPAPRRQRGSRDRQRQTTTADGRSHVTGGRPVVVVAGGSISLAVRRVCTGRGRRAHQECIRSREACRGSSRDTPPDRTPAH